MPEAVKAAKDWRKEFVRPFESGHLEQLCRLSEAVDRLWAAHTAKQAELRAKTSDSLHVWGQAEDTAPHSQRSVQEKDRILQLEQFAEGVRQSTPYLRLKLAMDYWCALWFWPLDKTELLPTREEFLFEISLLLQGEVFSTVLTERGQTFLPGFDPLNRGDRPGLPLQDELGRVDVESLCQQFERLRLVRELAQRLHFSTGNWNLPTSLPRAAALTLSWATRPGSRWNGTKAASWATMTRNSCSTNFRPPGWPPCARTSCAVISCCPPICVNTRRPRARRSSSMPCRTIPSWQE